MQDAVLDNMSDEDDLSQMSKVPKNMSEIKTRKRAQNHTETMVKEEAAQSLPNKKKKLIG